MFNMTKRESPKTYYSGPVLAAELDRLAEDQSLDGKLLGEARELIGKQSKIPEAIYRQVRGKINEALAKKDSNIPKKR